MTRCWPAMSIHRRGSTSTSPTSCRRATRRSTSSDRGGSGDAPAQEVHERGGAALRLVIPDEVPGVLDHGELRAGELLVEALRHLDAGEAVALAPQDQCRQLQRRETAIVGDQLVEVPGAVELEVP